MSLVLGLLSIVAIGVSHLALTDIWHGEADLRMEWNMLRAAALCILVFHVWALITLWRVLRKGTTA